MKRKLVAEETSDIDGEDGDGLMENLDEDVENEKLQTEEDKEVNYTDLILTKDQIAATCCSILSHPARHLPKLRVLVNQMDIRTGAEKCKLEFITRQKLLAFSILEVFLDVIPSYRVKEKIKEEDDKKRKLKKTTYELRNFESTLLAVYKLYLLRLKRMADIVKKPSSRPSTFYDSILTKTESKERICLIGLKCLSQLLITHPHFNLRNSIIQVIAPLTTMSKYPKAAEKACESIIQLFQQDKLGEVSLEVVKEIAKLIKNCGIYVRPQVIETYLHLRINEFEVLNSKKKDMKQIRKEWEKMSRKERRRKKAEKKLENQMIETEAKESCKRISEYHTKILERIFVCYFGFLKVTLIDLSDDTTKRERFKVLLSPVLEGIAKFCHLIDIQFFDDLINILFNLMKSDLLDTNQALNCCLTVFTILAQKESILDIDHQRFYCRLYQILPEIDCHTKSETILILLKCLEIMIIRKRRQISFSRVLAFMKRCAIISLQCNESTAFAIMSFLRRLLIDHPKSDLLLDVESIGSGMYLPYLDDPETCSANATHLWELQLLRRHVDQNVRLLVEHILKGCPSDEVKQEVNKMSTPAFYESLRDKEFSFLSNKANKTINITMKTKMHGYALQSSSLAQKYGNILCKK